MNSMRILAIESSCDDTSVALVEGRGEYVQIIKEANASQIDAHKIFGGVIPEVAARKHVEAIIPLLSEVYDKNNRPDAIAATCGPGLITSILVGCETAKTISALENIPFISVNHIEGHIYANWILENQNEKSRIKSIQFPALALIVSGGHTELILLESHINYKKLGSTRDDAAGECFDKVAKLLGFDYPGGPKISMLAENGNENAVKLPRPMFNSDDYDFSFSGLKTAALYFINDNPATKIDKKKLADFCASFEQSIVDVLNKKCVQAAKKYSVKSVLLAGGVAANTKLRLELKNSILENTQALFYCPPIAYCMDNAGMIGTVAYFKARNNQFTNWKDIKADPQWEIG